MSKLPIIFAVIFVVAVYGLPFEGDSSANYYFSNVQLTYLQALATCKRYGYNLATERSSADNDKLTAAIAKAQVTARSHFIGGMYQSSFDFRPGWVWMDSGERFNYTHWGRSQPSLTQCVLKGPVSLSGNWTTALCTTAAYFICEI